MESLRRHVEHQLARFDGRGSMPRIVAAWPDIVGEEIARNAWPARVARDGTLHLHTSSSVWAFELGQLAPAILERFSAELGRLAPAALRFTPGQVPEPDHLPLAERAQQPVPPPPHMQAEAASIAAGITDCDLRQQVSRAIALCLQRNAVNRPV